MTELDAEQLKFMDEEFCILVDKQDNATGFASKRTCHLNVNIFDTPTPLLHRAFSVLLFNERNELLLQQRAADKITFADYWTNTCCSHPLHGRTPDESADVAGVRVAAVRKLAHELGIVDADGQLGARFQPVTRVRYAARSNEVWGESEIDYILLVRVVEARTPLAPNANEVSATQYVSRQRMQAMLTDGTVLTPWFRLLCDHFLFAWWDQLEAQTDAIDVKFEYDTKINEF
jgi:isopentenyl-diphosphate delta-isomerase